jgi:hypothetical protein
MTAPDRYRQNGLSVGKSERDAIASQGLSMVIRKSTGQKLNLANGWCWEVWETDSQAEIDRGYQEMSEYLRITKPKPKPQKKK